MSDPVSPGSEDNRCTDVPARPPGRLDGSRCSVEALARADASMATASPVSRWLLIEQPGPWGRQALLQSRFDAEVAPLLAERAEREGVRVLLVRRPGDRLADSGRRWAYADSRPGREGLWWSVRSADADLLTAPWDGSVGVAAPGQTYLVCTHGGHDACCALRGRPLARTLPTPGPTDVWECSHLGGDRFAANLLVLPYGFYYGQVPGNGGLVVAAHDRGQVALPWLRGRAGVAAPAQAAQHYAREELGLLGVDDLAPLGVTPLRSDDAETERWEVTLAGTAGAVVVVTVESRPAPEAVRLTCQAVRPGRVRTWHHLSLSVRSAAG
ncbi:sucrase ferredoxin [Blastococcus capsensis]|uniref:sucrase ferredoxin n=1 Tax=Blastococcus capsensis TaxID=1564163 RepID=UPI0025424F22|nr:sucrase ferredoxin [Blastococcus capsensis]MDK3255985.1 sucrase ferredoxin [Blastococcus capsensis]